MSGSAFFVKPLDELTPPPYAPGQHILTANGVQLPPSWAPLQISARTVFAGLLPKNEEPSPRLRALSPIDAIQAWLDGDFGIGDELAMIAAIRMDTRVVMSHASITDVIFNAMNEGFDASTCLEQLTRSR